MEENINSNWIPTKKFFSEAILIALLTGVGYLAAFAYQYSYLKYFNVPTFFIDINIGLVLLTTSVGLVYLLGLGMAFNFFIGWKPHEKIFKIIKQTCISILIVFLAIFPGFASIYDPNNLWPLIIILAIPVTFIIIGIKVYRNPDLLGKTEAKRNKNDLLFKVEQLYGSFPILFVPVKGIQQQVVQREFQSHYFEQVEDD